MSRNRGDLAVRVERPCLRDSETREHEEALAAAIPGSRLVVYEETGHLVLWEHPERLAADLRAFLDRVDAGLSDSSRLP